MDQISKILCLNTFTTKCTEKVKILYFETFPLYFSEISIVMLKIHLLLSNLPEMFIFFGLFCESNEMVCKTFTLLDYAQESAYQLFIIKVIVAKNTVTKLFMSYKHAFWSV